MARTLDVYLLRDLVGQLIQDDHGQMLFQYGEPWLENPEASQISQSLPLRVEPFTRNECRGFFSGILPEESQREIIAGNLGISARNDFAMLAEIGGECAGAITFIPSGEGLPVRNDDYRRLTDQQLAETLRQLPRRPLLAGEDGIRLSLAGAQNKLAVYVSGDEISVPLGGAPSTHILKPAIDRFAGIVENEALCMNLAKQIGLKTARVEVRQVEDISYLLVERYDRHTHIKDGAPVTERLHQEDFCQALGIVPEHKYQREGGPSLRQSFGLLRDVSTAPVVDLQALLNAAIFNYLIGNNDAHGKNFSLLYSGANATERQIHIAPLYDLISTTFYPDLSSRMAMKIGSEYESGRVGPTHFEQFAEDVGLSKVIVRRRVPEIAVHLIGKIHQLDVASDIAAKVGSGIVERCEVAIARFKE